MTRKNLELIFQCWLWIVIIAIILILGAMIGGLIQSSKATHIGNGLVITSDRETGCQYLCPPLFSGGCTPATASRR